MCRTHFFMFFLGAWIELRFGPLFGSPFGSLCDNFGTKMSAEAAKRRPRGASGGGLFLGLFFGPTFESNLGPKGEWAYP